MTGACSTELNCPHCKLHIDEHPASRCLDAWVHTDVMGYKLPDHNWRDTHCDCIRNYPRDISAAWRVVEKIQRDEPGWRFGLLGGDIHFRWKAEFHGHIDPEQNYGQRHGQAYADTAPRAICLAALRAVGEE